MPEMRFQRDFDRAFGRVICCTATTEGALASSRPLRAGALTLSYRIYDSLFTSAHRAAKCPRRSPRMLTPRLLRTDIHDDFSRPRNIDRRTC